MDSADALGLLRDLLKVVGAGLVTHGAITAGNYELVAGIILAAFPIIWSHVVRWQQKAAIVKAAATGIAAPATVASPITPSPVDVVLAASAPKKVVMP